MTDSTAASATTPVVDAAAQAMNELHEVSLQTEQIIAELDGKPAGTTPSTVEPVTEDETERLRQRARRQRERGLKDIQRRYVGVASMLIPVVLNERVVGSAFERFFAVIENGLYVMTKHGEMFLGEKAAEQLMVTISDRIKKIEADADAELAATEIQIGVHAERTDWLAPTYIAPAAAHEVQVRTRLGADFCRVFVKLDKIMANLQALAWNGEVELSQIDDQEYRIKRDVRDLAKFTARTIRGMRTKVAPKAEAEAQIAQSAPVEAVA